MVARRRRAQLRGLVEERETYEQETLGTRETYVKEEQGRPECRGPNKGGAEVTKDSGRGDHRA